MATKTPTRARRAPVIRESVEQVWLAGLGALALAEEEGGKFYTTLVRKGEGFEKESIARLRKLSARAEGMRDNVRTNTIGRLGTGFDDAMTTMLHRLGVPTSREIASLTRRVETLTEHLAQGRVPARSAAADARRATTARRPRVAKRAATPRGTKRAAKPAAPATPA
jgi:poly(hydroxyalkanoate) granule-associated protein